MKYLLNLLAACSFLFQSAHAGQTLIYKNSIFLKNLKQVSSLKTVGDLAFLAASNSADLDEEKNILNLLGQYGIKPQDKLPTLQVAKNALVLDGSTVGTIENSENLVVNFSGKKWTYNPNVSISKNLQYFRQTESASTDSRLELLRRFTIPEAKANVTFAVIVALACSAAVALTYFLQSRPDKVIVEPGFFRNNVKGLNFQCGEKKEAFLMTESGESFRFTRKSGEISINSYDSKDTVRIKYSDSKNSRNYDLKSAKGSNFDKDWTASFLVTPMGQFADRLIDACEAGIDSEKGKAATAMINRAAGILEGQAANVRTLLKEANPAQAPAAQ